MKSVHSYTAKYAHAYVTRHEKTGLMYTKYTSSYYGPYLLYCLRYGNSVNCIRFLITCCINGENLIRLLYLSAKLFKLDIQKCGQILCAHKPYFLMPGHIYNTRYADNNFAVIFHFYMQSSYFDSIRRSVILFITYVRS